MSHHETDEKIWQKNGRQKNRGLYANIGRPFFCLTVSLYLTTDGKFEQEPTATPASVKRPECRFASDSASFVGTIDNARRIHRNGVTIAVSPEQIRELTLP